LSTDPRFIGGIDRIRIGQNFVEFSEHADYHVNDRSAFFVSKL
jgi:hypothetical protein